MHPERAAHSRSLSARRLAAALLLLLGSAAALAFNARDITGATYARDFALADHDGRLRRLEDFRGQVVVMAFGYLQCPDFCPVTLARLKQVVELMGEDAARVQVLFVTLDPQRDTPAALKQYVASFGPRVLGLRPEPEELTRFAFGHKVYAQVAPGAAPDAYTVDHSVFSYAYDAAGRLRLLIPFDISAQEIAADLRELLREPAR